MALSDVKIKAAKVPESKKQMALGVYPRIILKEARAKRESAKTLLDQNTDPSQSKQSHSNIQGYSDY